MAAVQLGNAHIGLFGDTAVQVVIPHLMAMPSTAGRNKAFILFDGDDYPTAFRGQGRSGTFSLSCRYGPDEAADLLALVDLIDVTAPSMPDARLLLRTHIGLAAGLDVAVAVEVEGDLTRTPVPEGAPGTVDVSFTVRIVEHTFAVA